MLTCLFQLQKIFPPLLFLVCPSMAGWLAILGATWSSSIPVSGASAGLRCPPRERWEGVGNGWILEEILVPLHAHDREIILHTFPCMFPWFTTYLTDFYWSIIIAFIWSNSNGSYKNFQIKPMSSLRALIQPVSPVTPRHKTYGTRRVSCLFFFSLIL